MSDVLINIGLGLRSDYFTGKNYFTEKKEYCTTFIHSVGLAG